jgi:hypothetical protein
MPLEECLVSGGWWCREERTGRSGSGSASEWMQAWSGKLEVSKRRAGGPKH